ncbi:MAG: AsmA family protein [Alphaproteobacteria bacterium]
MIVRKSLFFSIVRMVALSFVGLAVALVVALSQVNLDTLRGSIVAVLQDAIGMPVQVDGDVSWKLSLRPKIELNDVRIANADWAKSKYAYSADKIDVRLNLVSLFQDRPTIQNIRMYDVNINVEKNEAGQYSIPKFKTNVSDTTEKKSPEKYPIKVSGLGGVEIRKLKADVFGKKYKLSGLNVRLLHKGDKREYSGWIKFDEDVSSFIISMSEYNPERKIYPVQVAISTGGEALIGNIALEGTSKMPIDFIVKGELPNVSNIGKFFGKKISNINNVKVNLAGGLDRKKITLRKSDVNINGTEFTVSGIYDWGKNIPIIDVYVYSHKFDLTKIFPSNGLKKYVRPNRELNVFKDIPLFGELFWNRAVDINVEIDDFIMYRNLNIQNLDLVLKARDNRIRVDSELSIADGNVEFAIDGDVDGDGVLTADVGFMAKDVYVGEILKEINSSDFISELPVNIDLYVKTHGKNLSEVMQNLTGPVSVYSVGAGYAHSELVAYMYGADFLTTLRHGIQDLFNSEKKYNQIKISCLALNAKLRDGVFETQNGFAIETNAINVRLAGRLDLGGEKMNLSLTTVPVRGLKLSLTGKVVNSIALTGNLAEPDIKISGAAVAGKVASATGIGLLLAPLTGGLSLVAGAGIGLVAGDLLENWLADSHPCKTALEQGAPLHRDDPEWLAVPVSELLGNIIHKNNQENGILAE